MAHVRKQVRDAIASLLTSGVTLVSSRVYTSRVYPLTEAKLPAVLVYSTSESSGLMAMKLPTLDRSLSVSVDVYVRNTSTFDDDIDAICVQVEEAIGADFRLSGLVKETVLTATEIDYNGDAEQPVGVARLTYTVRYVTTVGDVETAR